MITCTRCIAFDAAHRIPNHVKCGKLHGHRYTLEATFIVNQTYMKLYHYNKDIKTLETNDLRQQYDNNIKILKTITYDSKKENKNEEKDINVMIIDFSIIKDKLKSWIDEHWDHNVILHSSDKELGNYISQYTGQSVFFINQIPTAEVLAQYLLILCNELFHEYDVTCIKIKLFETPNCYAECIL